MKTIDFETIDPNHLIRACGGAQIINFPGQGVSGCYAGEPTPASDGSGRRMPPPLLQLTAPEDCDSLPTPQGAPG